MRFLILHHVVITILALRAFQCDSRTHNFHLASCSFLFVTDGQLAIIICNCSGEHTFHKKEIRKPALKQVFLVEYVFDFQRHREKQSSWRCSPEQL